MGSAFVDCSYMSLITRSTSHGPVDHCTLVPLRDSLLQMGSSWGGHGGAISGGWKDKTTQEPTWCRESSRSIIICEASGISKASCEYNVSRTCVMLHAKKQLAFRLSHAILGSCLSLGFHKLGIQSHYHHQQTSIQCPI